MVINRPHVGNLNLREGHQYTALSGPQQFFLWLYIFAFSFDFKGAPGGSPIQVVFAGIAFIAFGSFMLLCAKRRTSSSLEFISSYWWTYIGITLVTVLVGTITEVLQVSMSMYLRVTLPYLMCGLSLIVCQRLASRNADPLVLITPMILCGLISSAWRAYYATHGAYATDVDDLRFQLLSPATPLLIAYGLVGIFAGRRVSPLALIALCAAGMSVLLSITRGYILTGFLCLTVLFAYMAICSKQSSAVLLRGLSRLMLVFCLGIALVGAVVVIRPNTFQTWESRIFSQNHGKILEDETYLVRMSEVSWDWKAISASPIYLLVGEGIGASYSHDTSILRQYKGSEDLSQMLSAPADCMWAYAMFSSGLIFGSMMLGIFVIPLVRIIRRTLAERVAELQGRYDLRLLTLVALVSYFSVIFTSAPFGERLFGVIMGFLVGLAYWPSKPANVR